MVNKARLIEKIAELDKDKRIDGITDLVMSPDRAGYANCIELRSDVNPNVVLNLLYKHTQLQDTFGVIMLALVNNEPKILNIHDMLKYYLHASGRGCNKKHQYDLTRQRKELIF